jgi:proteasome accessory factor B
VVSFSGRWYAVGRDVDRDEERLFRLSRVQGRARRVGRAGAYDVPPGTNLRELAKRLGPGPRSEKGTVLARTGTCLGLRRYATLLDEGVAGPDGTHRWDRLEVAYSSADQLADDVLALGPSACAESPEEVRKIVVERLTAAVRESA